MFSRVGVQHQHAYMFIEWLVLFINRSTTKQSKAQHVNKTDLIHDILRINLSVGENN